MSDAILTYLEGAGNKMERVYIFAEVPTRGRFSRSGSDSLEGPEGALRASEAPLAALLGDCVALLPDAISENAAAAPLAFTSNAVTRWVSRSRSSFSGVASSACTFSSSSSIRLFAAARRTPVSN